ncbi:MAG: hypothetical protein QOH96_4349 [Blastocatellia bacterium]|nr:hypothetical protein [Blastocatellia bacterium]
MLVSILLTLLVVASGTVVTYLYDEGSPLAARLCAGACLGLTALGLVGFVVASVMGLTPLSICISGAIVGLPLLLLRKPERLTSVRNDLRSGLRNLRYAVERPSVRSTGTVLFFLSFTILMWLVFDRVMFERAGAIYTGEPNNYGDLPFHLSVITSFAKGDNFPPEDPTYSGVRFTYPFVVDFVAAMFVHAGTSLASALFIENIVLAVSTVGLLWRFGLALTRDRLAALFTVLLVVFSGGLGFLKLRQDVESNGKGIFDLISHLPNTEYTIIPNTVFRWGNSISALLLPQRSLLMGLPLALIVFTLWWKGWRTSDVDLNDTGEDEKESNRRSEITPKKGQKNRKVPKDADAIGERGSHYSTSPRPDLFRLPIAALKDYQFSRSMLAAGLIAGLLPLVHAHTFVSVIVVGLCLAAIGGVRNWPNWFLFFLAATVVGAPQMLWAATGSAVQTSKFFGWEFGWDHGNEPVYWFWLENTGLFIPLLVLALGWRGKKPFIPKRLLLFYLPFTICFIVPNVFKLAPWIWDNIKVLIYWWIGSAPIVALLLAKLWKRSPAWQIISAILLAVLIFSGALDVYRIASSQAEFQEFDSNGVAFSKLVEERTSPKSLILHATTHNHPLFLTGRRSVMGYPGHIWTHGLEFSQRATEIRMMYAGGSNALPLMKKYGVDYVVVSGIENSEMSVNNLFFEESMTKVGEVGEYRLYKVPSP